MTVNKPNLIAGKIFRVLEARLKIVLNLIFRFFTGYLSDSRVGIVDLALQSIFTGSNEEIVSVTETISSLLPVKMDCRARSTIALSHNGLKQN